MHQHSHIVSRDAVPPAGQRFDRVLSARQHRNGFSQNSVNVSVNGSVNN